MGRENEREGFWMSFMGRCVECEAGTEGEAGSSVWFSVDWLGSAERSEPKQRTVIVPWVAVQWTVPRGWRLRQGNPGPMYAV
jgi:hypothetical protein